MTWLIPSKSQQSIKKVPLRLGALEDKTVVTLMYFRRLFLSELLYNVPYIDIKFWALDADSWIFT